MTGRFAGQAALVTGGGGGIGAAIARRLAAEGASVVVTDLVGEAADAVARHLGAQGGEAWASSLDVTRQDDVERVLQQAEERYGPARLVVTAAGVDHQHAFLDLPLEEWEHTLAVNLRGTFLVFQGAARRLVRRGLHGHMVAIASAAGKRPNPTQAHYGAAKAGVINLVHSAAVALARHGIVVNAVCPGVVDTEMTKALHRERAELLGIDPAESLRRMLDLVPAGRIETVEDVAGAVAFLLSCEADYMVGQAVNVCGGLVFH